MIMSEFSRKDITRKGILATQILGGDNQFFRDDFEEMIQETKPSRTARSASAQKKSFEAPRRKKFNDHDD
jgi:hypothetical protein